MFLQNLVQNSGLRIIWYATDGDISFYVDDVRSAWYGSLGVFLHGNVFLTITDDCDAIQAIQYRDLKDLVQYAK